MAQRDDDSQRAYERLCREFRDMRGVTLGSDGPQRRGFGSSALRVDGRIFAMLVGGRLVVKLPHHEVEALVAAGEGERYDAGRGRPLKEWLVVESPSEAQWLRLARDAFAFVAKRTAA